MFFDLIVQGAVLVAQYPAAAAATVYAAACGVIAAVLVF